MPGDAVKSECVSSLLGVRGYGAVCRSEALGVDGCSTQIGNDEAGWRPLADRFGLRDKILVELLP
jgi:hypothetical protein